MGGQKVTGSKKYGKKSGPSNFRLLYLLLWFHTAYFLRVSVICFLKLVLCIL